MSGKGNRKATRWVDTESPDKEPSEDILCHVYTVESQRVNPYKVVLELNGSPTAMKIDTGAAVSIISEKTQKSLFPTAELAKPTVRICTCTSNPIRVGADGCGG